DDEGIARRDAALIGAPDLADLRSERADVQRLWHALRHHAPLGIADREGEVLALLDDRGVAGAQHVERELARDLRRRLVDDLEVARVHGALIPLTSRRRSSAARRRSPPASAW